ncbi:MAG: phytanoyl-CoA dioxygenase family protein [Bacteroidota bacterium]
MTPKEFFDQNGYVVVKNAWTSTEIEHYKEMLKTLKAKSSKNSWTQPDGVTQNRGFWPVIFNEKILATVRTLIGEQARFLQHNDLHVGFSSLTWHRDSVNRIFGKGGDWEEQEEPYRLLRVGTYLQEGQSGFRLGMIPGSQRPNVHLSPAQVRQIEKRSSTLASVTSLATGKNWLSQYTKWIPTEAGDSILFDPRILHTGSKFEKVKYSFFTAYGHPNTHYHRHHHYYRHARTDLSYRALHPDLVRCLEEAGLYATEKDAAGLLDQNAYIPSAAFSYIASYFK